MIFFNVICIVLQFISFIYCQQMFNFTASSKYFSSGHSSNTGEANTGVTPGIIGIGIIILLVLSPHLSFICSSIHFSALIPSSIINLFTSHPVNLSVCVRIYVYIYQSISISIYLSTCTWYITYVH